jgi:hypothetical protein
MSHWRFWLGFAALLACFSIGFAGFAQKPIAHLEYCTRWGDIDAKGGFGTSNTCPQPVVIRFMRAGDQRIVERTLKPGEVFDTGLTREQIHSGWWMFTTCPVGYASSVAFTAQNRNALIASKYRCVRK